MFQEFTGLGICGMQYSVDLYNRNTMWYLHLQAIEKFIVDKFQIMYYYQT